MTEVISSVVYEDLLSGELIKHALNKGEGELAANQALAVTTGKRTGRSPKDRFIVKDDMTASTVHWGPVNQPISKECFDALWKKTAEYLKERDVYKARLQV